jgi:hypothetical protein
MEPLMILASTADRVTTHSPQSANERIAAVTRAHIEYYRLYPELITERLEALDNEWDIERCLEMGSSTLTLTGLALGTFVNKRWYLLSALVQGFFLQHAVQGWCPPLPVLRGLGVRTMQEIDAERCALLELQQAYIGGP